MNEGPEQELIARIVAGETELFSELLERYRTRVFSSVAKFVPREEIDSVAHDAFVEIFKSLRGFRGQGSFEGWVTRIATRQAYAFLRKRYKQDQRETIAPAGQQQQEWLERAGCEDAQNQHDAQEAQRNAEELLEWAMKRLKPEDQMVVTLIHIEERSVADVSALLGWSTTAVKVRAFRARKRLHALLSPLMEDK